MTPQQHAVRTRHHITNARDLAHQAGRRGLKKGETEDVERELNAALAAFTSLEIALGWKGLGALLADEHSSDRRDATAAELADEPDGVLESMAEGDLEVTPTTRHLARAELDYRRERR